MFVFTSKGHDGASSRKAALLIPAACQSPGLCLLLGAAGGEVTSIKERAELLIKLFVSYSFWAGSTQVQFACGQTPISHPCVGEEGGLKEGNAEGGVPTLHKWQGIQVIRNRNYFLKINGDLGLP